MIIMYHYIKLIAAILSRAFLYLAISFKKYGIFIFYVFIIPFSVNFKQSFTVILPACYNFYN